MAAPSPVLLFAAHFFAAALFAGGCSSGVVDDDPPSSSETTGGDSEYSLARSYDDIPINPAEPTYVLTDEEWREILSEEAYEILRNEGTERAFSGALLGNERDGIYHCAGCGHPLFSSETRFDSRTGWPSFWLPYDDDAVGTRPDQGHIEVHCARCGGHQGHVFPDGPPPTGLRYCINSLALEFREDGGH